MPQWLLSTSMLSVCAPAFSMQPCQAQTPSVRLKIAVVGTGGAEKRQIQAMVGVLLPGAKVAGPDAADALAVAICHAHHVASATGMMRRAQW